MKQFKILFKSGILLSLLTLLIAFNISFKTERNHCNEITNLSKKYFDSTSVKGISVGIYNYKNNTFIQCVNGVSHDNQSVTKDMLWGIGSNTKTFVAVLTLKLAEEGLLNINDKIGKYIPKYKNIDSNITIRQILQHHSGLVNIYESQDFTEQLSSFPLKKWEPKEALNYIPKPIGKPDTVDYYADANFIIAGIIIEKVTGMQLHVAMRKYITEPLELTDTYFKVYESNPKTLTHPWVGDKDLNNVPRTALYTSTWAAGAMISSPKNMMKWYQALFNHKFLSETYFNEFISFKPWDADQFYQYVGLGIYKIEHNGKIYYGHGGGVAGYFSFTLYDLKTKNSIIAMTTGDFFVAEKLSYEIAELFQN
ncbi:serine hydrolase domain-containing protein [Flavivirga algicola]|uniref:Beta-lactamase family protein n=1 Tax=Flavivirga algicola TaxID=2729136 RepID=A0ABX1RQT8_9FLAO|nr:serine hydrolase domain-containing protein [Flavivirga algicola]NMH85919.1 beta-lactamase family protein [Flavivirga algicola]